MKLFLSVPTRKSKCLSLESTLIIEVSINRKKPPYGDSVITRVSFVRCDFFLFFFFQLEKPRFKPRYRGETHYAGVSR